MEKGKSDFLKKPILWASFVIGGVLTYAFGGLALYYWGTVGWVYSIKSNGQFKNVFDYVLILAINLIVFFLRYDRYPYIAFFLYVSSVLVYIICGNLSKYRYPYAVISPVTLLLLLAVLAMALSSTTSVRLSP